MQLLKSNKFWLAGNYTILIISSFINLKLNIISFGQEIFGIWLLLLSFWSFTTQLDFGIGISLTRNVAYFSEKDDQELTRIVSTSFATNFVLSLVLFIITNLIIYYVIIKSSSNLNIIPHDTIVKTSVFLGINFIFQFLRILPRSICEGYDKFIQTSKIEIVNSTLLFLITLTVYLFDFSIEYLAFGYLSVSFIILIIYYRLYLKSFNNLLRYRAINGNTLKSIAKFNLPLQLSSISGAIVDPIVKFLIGNFLSLHYITNFEIARRFSTAIAGLYQTTVKTILVESSTKNYVDNMKTFFEKTGYYTIKRSITFSALMYGVFSIFITLIILYFYKLPEALPIFFILVLSESVNNYGYTFFVSFISSGKTRINFYLQLINVLLIPITLFIGIYFYKTVYSFISYFIAVSIVNFIIVLYVHKTYSVSVKEILNKTNFIKLGQFLFVILLCISITGVFQISYILINIILMAISIMLFRNELMEEIKIINKLITH